jgi:hypothetical protein
VEVAVLENNDLLVGGALESLDIKDELSCIQDYCFQYLAHSHSNQKNLSSQDSTEYHHSAGPQTDDAQTDKLLGKLKYPVTDSQSVEVTDKLIDKLTDSQTGKLIGKLINKLTDSRIDILHYQLANAQTYELTVVQAEGPTDAQTEHFDYQTVHDWDKTKRGNTHRRNESEQYFDAGENFSSSEPSSPLTPSSSHTPSCSRTTIYYDWMEGGIDEEGRGEEEGQGEAEGQGEGEAEGEGEGDLFKKSPPSFGESFALLPSENSCAENGKNIHGNNFIKYQYISRNEDSEDYNGVDSHVHISYYLLHHRISHH